MSDDITAEEAFWKRLKEESGNAVGFPNINQSHWIAMALKDAIYAELSEVEKVIDKEYSDDVSDCSGCLGQEKIGKKDLICEYHAFNCIFILELKEKIKSLKESEKGGSMSADTSLQGIPEEQSSLPEKIGFDSHPSEKSADEAPCICGKKDCPCVDCEDCHWSKSKEVSHV